MSDNIITIQTLFVLPFSALNRDDTGAPKHYYHGGVMRGQLSSQSLKRAARVNFENKIMRADRSIRSGELADEVMSRVLAISESRGLNEKLQRDTPAFAKMRKTVEEKLVILSKSDKPKGGSTTAPVEEAEEAPATTKGNKAKPDDIKDDQKSISMWLSDEEIELMANEFANGKIVDMPDVIKGATTGSLSIAAFGRMFSNASLLSTEAAIAVSDASCVHASMIELDYFTTVADYVEGGRNSNGATYLAEQAFTSGVFHRSFTIDVAQLRKSWSGMNREDAAEKLSLLVDELINSLPGGKKNSTAPYTPALMVLAEKQRRRQSYHFETPVTPATDGGYAQNAISALATQAEQLRAFDPEMIAEALVAGTADVSAVPGDQTNLPALRAKVVDWILN